MDEDLEEVLRLTKAEAYREGNSCNGSDHRMVVGFATTYAVSAYHR